MKKLTILLDLDGIVIDTLPTWLECINNETGVDAKVEHITQWDMTKCPPLNDLNPDLIFKHLQTPGFVKNLKPMAGAVENVQKLINDGHNVYFVTARHGPVSMPETLEWFQKHLPNVPFKNVVFCYDKALILGDVLIDDKRETLEEYHMKHIDTLLGCINYQYNKTAKVDMRVDKNERAWDILYALIKFHAEQSDKPVTGNRLSFPYSMIATNQTI